MPHYLLQATYTSGAWDTLMKNPQNRFEAIRPPIEKLGGNIEHGWLAFGEDDIIAILQMPDNECRRYCDRVRSRRRFEERQNYTVAERRRGS